MPELECYQCGKHFKGRSNKKYCSEECSRESQRQRSAEVRRIKKAAGLKTTESLSRLRYRSSNAALMEDASRADASGDSYGVWKGKQGPENLWENRRGVYR